MGTIFGIDEILSRRNKGEIRKHDVYLIKLQTKILENKETNSQTSTIQYISR